MLLPFKLLTERDTDEKFCFALFHYYVMIVTMILVQSNNACSTERCLPRYFIIPGSVKCHALIIEKKQES